MKFFGKELKDVKKGYFGIRRCTVCDEMLRDVDLVEMHAINYICFIPLRNKIIGRLLVCRHCNAFMEINNDLWEYYSTYYNQRFNKATTDTIVNTLSNISNQMELHGVKLNMEDKIYTKSIDLIYKSLAEKYGVCENIEEIISVFYK